VAFAVDTAYRLTELGVGAYRALRPLVRWSHEWATALTDDEPVAHSYPAIEAPKAVNPRQRDGG
jgi:DNA-binding HxlR family transcriptional regulator